MPTGRSRLGSTGEKLARQYLEQTGYRILETNFRCRWGEVDIIAQQDGLLLFVEVKTRRSATFGIPEESITKAKTQRLIAAAETYLDQSQAADSHWRIDLISVEMDRSGKLMPLRHLQNAVERPYPC